jgi:anti-sigma factor RsiW
MTTTELQTECSQSERINSFLANRLDPSDRQALVAHLGVCEHCASLLGELREDERLAQIPLTAEERSRIQAIVHQVRSAVAVRLDEDRRGRQSGIPRAAAPVPRFAPPGLAQLAPGLGRVFWLSVAAVLVLAAALWIAVDRLGFR